MVYCSLEVLCDERLVFYQMFAARYTQNAQGRSFQRPRFGAQLAQALSELDSEV